MAEARRPFPAKPFLAWVLLLAALMSGASPAPERLLIRIDKAAAAALPVSAGEKIQAFKDLGAFWLALADSEGLRALDEAAAPYEIIDRNPSGKAYFLVRAAAGEPLGALAAYGSFHPLGGRTAVFWSGGREAREILPAPWTVVRLALDRSLPLEDTTPAARPEARPAAAAADYDPAIAAWAAQVSKARLATLIDDLQNFRTRYVTTAGCESAGTYLRDELARTGLAAEFDPFTFGSGRTATRNIVATLPGQTLPDRTVIVCGHYDSKSNQAATLAPGADDNGSGTAAVLEIARVLAGQRFDFTIRFICFSAEEWGLYGSGHYAAEARARGEKILAVINMDMVGYPDPYTDRMDVVVNGGSQWLFDRYTRAAAAYAGMRTRKILDNAWHYSDQAPFWDYGYSALCGIENEDPNNPNYHKTTDLLSTLDLDFAAAVTRASLAAAADLAQPVGTPRMPTGLLARSQIVGSLYAGLKTVALRWAVNPDAVAGYHVYRSKVSGGPYEKLNAEPLPAPGWTDRFLERTATYYYVVTAVDDQGRESRASLEAADMVGAWGTG
jgi:hypothetical protein